MGRDCVHRIPARRGAGEEERGFLTLGTAGVPSTTTESDQITLLQSEQETRRSRSRRIGGDDSQSGLDDRTRYRLEKNFKGQFESKVGKDRGLATIGNPRIFNRTAGTGSLRRRMFAASVLLGATGG